MTSERAPQDVLRELQAAIAELPEPMLGLKGGVNRLEVLHLIDKAITEAPDSPPVAWLIERGQPEKQVPTVWWADRKRWGLTYMDDWTADAYKAFRFESREAAEEVIAAKFTPPPSRGGPTARAVEHGFIAAPDTLSEKPGLDVERWIESLREDNGLVWVTKAELREVLASSRGYSFAVAYSMTEPPTNTARNSTRSTDSEGR